MITSFDFQVQPPQTVRLLTVPLMFGFYNRRAQVHFHLSPVTAQELEPKGAPLLGPLSCMLERQRICL